MLTAIVNNHIDYNIYAHAWYSIILCKFVASSALHLILYPEIAKTMALMKYTLNHSDDFTHPKVAFGVPLLSHTVNIFAEGMNLFQLLFWSSVEFTIVYFVALAIVVKIPNIYMECLMDDKLKDKLFDDYPILTIHNAGKDIKWESRTFSNKVGRTIYRFHRTLYVAVIFYFQPFILIISYRYLV